MNKNNDTEYFLSDVDNTVRRLRNAHGQKGSKYYF